MYIYIHMGGCPSGSTPCQIFNFKDEFSSCVDLCHYLDGSLGLSYHIFADLASILEITGIKYSKWQRSCFLFLTSYQIKPNDRI